MRDDQRMLSEDHAASVAQGIREGRYSAKYRPSNGTEGDMFADRWCDRCTKDLHAPHDGGCPIIVAALVFHKDDEGYPDEWTYDESGQPCCTAFDPLAAAGAPDMGGTDR